MWLDYVGLLELAPIRPTLDQVSASKVQLPTVFEVWSLYLPSHHHVGLSEATWVKITGDPFSNGGVHSHGGTPIAGWFIRENLNPNEIDDN